MNYENLYEKLNESKIEYLKYRGSSFNTDGTLFWAKDDVQAWAEGFDTAVNIIKEHYGTSN